MRSEMKALLLSMLDQAQEDEFLLDSLSESSGFHQTFYYHSCSVGI